MQCHSRRKRENFISWLSLFLSVPLFVLSDSTTFGQEAVEPEELTFGVFPLLSVSRLEPIFSPIAAILKDSLEINILYRNTTHFDQFTDNLRNKYYHLAYLNPLDYTNCAKEAGYIPLVTQTDSLHMLFVVLESHPIRKMEDVKGQTVIVPPRMSAGAFLTAAKLNELGLDTDHDIRLKHAPRYDACLQQLLIGDADVAVVAPSVLRKFEREMNIKFRVLQKSSSIPNNLFAVHGSLSPEVIQKIKTTLLSISLPWQAEEFFEHSSPFVPTTDENYDIVRHDYKELLQPIGRK